jgi:hypothetical protein
MCDDDVKKRNPGADGHCDQPGFLSGDKSTDKRSDADQTYRYAGIIPVGSRIDICNGDSQEDAYDEYDKK